MADPLVPVADRTRRFDGGPDGTGHRMVPDDPHPPAPPARPRPPRRTGIAPASGGPVGDRVRPGRRRRGGAGVRGGEAVLRRGRRQVQRADPDRQRRVVVAAVAWRRRLRSGEERGVTTIEFVMVAWLFMVMVLGGLQFGLWWHAQHVVLGAAQDGAPQAGRARALELLQVGLGRDAATATVDVRRDPQVARATVTARLRPLLPIGSSIQLRATARAFAEQF